MTAPAGDYENEGHSKPLAGVLQEKKALPTSGFTEAAAQEEDQERPQRHQNPSYYLPEISVFNVSLALVQTIAVSGVGHTAVTAYLGADGPV